jgi:hypothetical protein
MGFPDWLGQNWFILLQSGGIIASLLFTAVSLRKDAKARRVSNLITITDHHREIWTQLYRRPDLARVIDATVDVQREPVRDDEELFINLLILHLSSAYHAMKEGLFLRPEGLRQDIDWFFSLPIPQMVWERSKALQDEEFVSFVEAEETRK